MINLNKIPRGVLFITNIIVIILLIAAIGFLYAEIYFIKSQGGQCVNNPMAWAEKYAREEKGLIVDCSCRQIGDHFELNLSGQEKTYE
ncbi:hypothetical protein ES702_04459 [subsurface metagenome]